MPPLLLRGGKGTLPMGWKRKTSLRLNPGRLENNAVALKPNTKEERESERAKLRVKLLRGGAWSKRKDGGWHEKVEISFCKKWLKKNDFRRNVLTFFGQQSVEANVYSKKAVTKRVRWEKGLERRGTQERILTVDAARFSRPFEIFLHYNMNWERKNSSPGKPINNFLTSTIQKPLPFGRKNHSQGRGHPCWERVRLFTIYYRHATRERCAEVSQSAAILAQEFWGTWQWGGRHRRAARRSGGRPTAPPPRCGMTPAGRMCNPQPSDHWPNCPRGCLARPTRSAPPPPGGSITFKKKPDGASVSGLGECLPIRIPRQLIIWWHTMRLVFRVPVSERWFQRGFAFVCKSSPKSSIWSAISKEGWSTNVVDATHVPHVVQAHHGHPCILSFKLDKPALIL